MQRKKWEGKCVEKGEVRQVDQRVGKADTTSSWRRTTRIHLKTNASHYAGTVMSKVRQPGSR